jgi:hypothetical protein
VDGAGAIGVAQLGVVGLCEDELVALGWLVRDEMSQAWVVAERAKSSVSVLMIYSGHWSYLKDGQRPFIRRVLYAGEIETRRRSLCVLITWAIAGQNSAALEQAWAERWGVMIDSWGHDEVALAFELVDGAMGQGVGRLMPTVDEVDGLLGAVTVLGGGGEAVKTQGTSAMVAV